jgi:hypothetical protein
LLHKPGTISKHITSLRAPPIRDLADIREASGLLRSEAPTMRDTSDAPMLTVLVCPRCHSNKLVALTSMRRHDPRDWYKCDGCEHIVVVAKPVPEVAQDTPGQAVD